MFADARNGENSPSRRRVPSGPSPLLGRITVRIWPPTLELPRSHDEPASRSAIAEESAAAGPVRKGLSSPLRNLRERASHVRDEYVKEPLRATAEYMGETRVVGAIRDTAEYVGERASHVKDEYVKEPLRATAEYMGETRVVTKVRETMSETAEYVGETRVVTTIRELLPERRWSVPRCVANCPSAGGAVHPLPARLPARRPQPSHAPCSLCRRRRFRLADRLDCLFRWKDVVPRSASSSGAAGAIPRSPSFAELQSEHSLLYSVVEVLPSPHPKPSPSLALTLTLSLT